LQNCFQPSEGETLSGKSDEFSRDINPNYMSAALYEWDDVLSSTASEVNPRLASNLAPAARRNARGGTRCRSTELNSVYRRLLQMTLEKLQFLERPISQVDQERASLLSQHVDAVRRLAEVPGLGVDPVRQILAEVEAYGTDISFGETAVFMGWRMLRRQTERGGFPEPPFPERQSPYAAYSQSMCPRRGQSQRKHLRDRGSPVVAAPGRQANRRGDCPSALPTDLDDFASRGPF
jgi:hypothetical protein